MRNWTFFVLCLALTTGMVSAQDRPPPLGEIGTLEAGDFRALAVTAEGDRLLVADAENQQVRIYNFTDPANPTLLWSLDVSGTPVLLAGGEDYGLVAVTTDDSLDRLEVLAPQLPGARAPYSPGYNYVDIPKNPRVLALSPDQQWGIVVSERGYVVLGINAPGDIDNFVVDETILDAALSNTTAYLLRGQVLAMAPLGDLEAMQAEQVLGLGGEASSVTLNTDATEGVVVLDDNRLVFFDPSSLARTGEFTLEGSPITGVHFLTKDDSEYLIVTQEETSTIAVLDAADPQDVQTLSGTPALANAIRALAIFQQYLIVTDGVTISIFSA